MAIRFVDVEPGEAAEPAGGKRAPAPEPASGRKAAPGLAPEPEPEPTSGPAEGGPALDGGASAPDLPHPKPEPKPRGRKKPMSAAGANKRADGRAGDQGDGQPDDKAGGRAGRASAPETASVPLLEGLLPELQAHAKPAPKPRGRKKAFG